MPAFALANDYWMVKVKLVVAVMLGVTVSTPPTVMVYVPLGGLETVVELLLLPQALIASPTVIKTITPAKVRNCFP